MPLEKQYLGNHRSQPASQPLGARPRGRHAVGLELLEMVKEKSCQRSLCMRIPESRITLHA